MQKFKEKDLVRVKAGVPARNYGTGLPEAKVIGKKLVIVHDPLEYRQDTNMCDVAIKFPDSKWERDGICHTSFLEPWKDGEFWNGQKWIKGPACIVTTGTGSGIRLRSVCENEETANKTIELAEENGQYQVWEHKSTKTVEKPKYDSFKEGEKVLVNGNCSNGITHYIRNGLAIVLGDSDENNNCVSLGGLHITENRMYRYQTVSKKDVAKLNEY